MFNGAPKYRRDGCPSGYAGRMGETVYAQRHSKVSEWFEKPKDIMFNGTPKYRSRTAGRLVMPAAWAGPGVQNGLGCSAVRVGRGIGTSLAERERYRKCSARHVSPAVAGSKMAGYAPS